MGRWLHWTPSWRTGPQTPQQGSICLRGPVVALVPGVIGPVVVYAPVAIRLGLAPPPVLGRRVARVPGPAHLPQLLTRGHYRDLSVRHAQNRLQPPP